MYPVAPRRKIDAILLIDVYGALDDRQREKWVGTRGDCNHRLTVY
jgi:hypothetical protein